MSLRRNDLINVCKMWALTHDVGLGVYTWMKSLDSIIVLQDHTMHQVKGEKYFSFLTYLQILFHKAGREYDRLFEQLWSLARYVISGDEDQEHFDDLEFSYRRNSLADPPPGIAFDVDRFLEYEKKIAYAINEHYPPYKLNGMKNTILFRKWQIRQHLVEQVQYTPESYANDIEMTHRDYDKNFDPIGYSSKNCAEDKLLYDVWALNKKERSQPFDAPFFCSHYGKHVSNLIYSDVGPAFGD
jgi:hypothetical protein